VPHQTVKSFLVLFFKKELLLISALISDASRAGSALTFPPLRGGPLPLP
jgi:hypothetical protein